MTRVTRSPRAWLGSSVAIKDPTFVRFERHSGTNLLVVGQHDELSAGMLATSCVALAANEPPASDDGAAPQAEFVILDGTRADEAGYPDVGTAPATIEKTGTKALVESIGILGTCIREAPEFASRRRHAR